MTSKQQQPWTESGRTSNATMVLVAAAVPNATPRQAVTFALSRFATGVAPDEAFVTQVGSDGQVRVLAPEEFDGHFHPGNELQVHWHPVGSCPLAPISVDGERRPVAPRGKTHPLCDQFARHFLGRPEPFDCPRCRETGLSPCAFRALWRCKHYVCSACADELSPYPPLRVACHRCDALPRSPMAVPVFAPPPPTDAETRALESGDPRASGLVPTPLAVGSDTDLMFVHRQYFCAVCQRRRAFTHTPGRCAAPDFKCCGRPMTCGSGGHVREGDTVWATAAVAEEEEAPSAPKPKRTKASAPCKKGNKH